MSTLPPPRTTTGEHLRPVDDLRPVDEPRRDSQPAITREDVDDLGLVPRHLRMVASEVSELVALVRGAVVPAIKRIEERQQDEERYTQLQLQRLHARIDKLQAMIAGDK